MHKAVLHRCWLDTNITVFFVRENTIKLFLSIIKKVTAATSAEAATAGMAVDAFLRDYLSSCGKIKITHRNLKFG